METTSYVISTNQCSVIMWQGTYIILSMKFLYWGTGLVDVLQSLKVRGHSFYQEEKPCLDSLLHPRQTVPTCEGRQVPRRPLEKLAMTTHVATTAKKANNSLAFLIRNLSSCPHNIKDQCYQTLVRPILEYASCAWDPHTKANISQLEAVQRPTYGSLC